jgi:hypothetical protein
MDDAAGIPRPLLAKYCLKGIGSQDGTFMMKPELSGRIHFRQINLNATLPDIGQFDVIFLRNVMIYFDLETKRQVIRRILPLLRPGAISCSAIRRTSTASSRYREAGGLNPCACLTGSSRSSCSRASGISATGTRVSAPCLVPVCLRCSGTPTG